MPLPFALNSPGATEADLLAMPIINAAVTAIVEFNYYPWPARPAGVVTLDPLLDAAARLEQEFPLNPDAVERAGFGQNPAKAWLRNLYYLAEIEAARIAAELTAQLPLLPGHELPPEAQAAFAHAVRLTRWAHHLANAGLSTNLSDRAMAHDVINGIIARLTQDYPWLDTTDRPLRAMSLNEDAPPFQSPIRWWDAAVKMASGGGSR